MNKLSKVAVSSIAVLLGSATLAACGSDSEGETGAAAPPKSDFLPCIVSDAGGFDDKSFNQLSYSGVEAAASELNSDFKSVESNADTDYAPNIQGLVDEGCEAIVTVGFALSAATVESAKDNPDLDYILIDDAADTDFDGTTDAKNIKPLLYNTAEAAFMAGYLAADYSTTGVVGTYGGAPYPTVTIFMDGFKQGVDYYNEAKDAAVKVVGWDGKDGSFTGGFENNNVAAETAKGLLDQDVDVILPVGGPIYQAAVTAIADSGKDIALVGVDADLYETDPSTQPYVLTSILKKMDVSTQEAVIASGNGEFDPTPYIGTLDNGGVDIAPMHDFESKVSDTVMGELDEIRAAIISGDIKVKSYLG
ncbi:MAG: BMP family lipoprotein [Nocardioides sp.]